MSYWEYQSYWHKRDVVIVGMGLTGLLTAINIKKTHPEASVLIVDEKLIGSGASSRNAGFACFGSISELESDVAQFGLDECLKLVKLRFDGLAKLRSVVGDSIGYIESGGFEVFEHKSDAERYLDRVAYWNDALSHITGLENSYKEVSVDRRLRFYDRAICNSKEGLLNTGKLNIALETIAAQNGIQIFRGLRLGTFEDSYNENLLYFDGVDRPLLCKALVLCTNAFTKQLIPNLDVLPSRNQVLMTSAVDNSYLKGGYHLDKGYIYFRSIADKVLIGGARNYFKEEDGKTEFGENADNVEYLLHILREKILPGQKFEMEYNWSGILSGGALRTPIVKYHSDNIVLAVRMGGMGVAIGANVAEQAAVLVSNRLKS